MAGKANAVDNLDVEALKKYLTINSLKSTQLSELMGYDKSYLSGILCKKFAITKPAYKMLCMILKVDEDKFLIKPNNATFENENVTQSIDLNGVVDELGNLNSTLKSLNGIYNAINTQNVLLTKLISEFHEFTLKFGSENAKEGDTTQSNKQSNNLKVTIPQQNKSNNYVVSGNKICK